ncbi:MAG: M20/M25/M40 family metallo-hydrolase [Pyramidobacter sp.]|nr:M20/M25/M40 family metallo-hydrolase [Pyramidobacter sp.]
MNTMEKAFAYVDEHFDEMLEELKGVCRCASVASNAQGLRHARERIAQDMRRSGLNPKFCDVEGGNALISAELRGESAETILFYNHYDVVEPGKPENWTNGAPFEPEIRDGRMYARGVSDDKGALYSRIHAVRALTACGKLPVTIKFLTEGDEETSSPSMTKFAREHADEFKDLISSDVCLWENGRVDAAGHPWLRCGVRGSIAFDLRVTTANSDVHGRMGATIPSASWRLVWALSTLKTPDERIAIEGFYDDVCPATEADLQVLRDFPYAEEAQKKSLGIASYLRGATGEALKRQVYLEPSLSICGLEAGETHNGVRGIVPHTAYARISFYLVADQNPAELESKLRRHLDAHGFSDVEITRRGGSSRPVRTSPDHPFCARARAAAQSVYEQPMVIELTQLGGGPAGILRDALPCLPIFGVGPASVSGNHHAPDENLVIEDYRRAVKYLIALMCSYE